MSKKDVSDVDIDKHVSFDLSYKPNQRLVDTSADIGTSDEVDLVSEDIDAMIAELQNGEELTFIPQKITLDGSNNIVTSAVSTSSDKKQVSSHERPVSSHERPVSSHERPVSSHDKHVTGDNYKPPNESQVPIRSTISKPVGTVPRKHKVTEYTDHYYRPKYDNGFSYDDVYGLRTNDVYGSLYSSICCCNCDILYNLLSNVNIPDCDACELCCTKSTEKWCSLNEKHQCLLIILVAFILIILLMITAIIIMLVIIF